MSVTNHVGRFNRLLLTKASVKVILLKELEKENFKSWRRFARRRRFVELSCRADLVHQPDFRGPPRIESFRGERIAANLCQPDAGVKLWEDRRGYSEGVDKAEDHLAIVGVVHVRPVEGDSGEAAAVDFSQYRVCSHRVSLVSSSPNSTRSGPFYVVRFSSRAPNLISADKTIAGIYRSKRSPLPQKPREIARAGAYFDHPGRICKGEGLFGG